jgi:hypothetical protein
LERAVNNDLQLVKGTGENMRILFVLFMLGAAGIAWSQTPQEPFSITISAEKPQVRAGDPVYIKIAMKNISDHDVDCTMNAVDALDRNFRYDILDENSQTVQKIPKKYPQIGDDINISPCIIQPGETAHAFAGLVSILYDLTRPGKYTIQVARGVWGDGNRPGTAGRGENSQPVVKSNTITITVLPPDPPADEPK